MATAISPSVTASTDPTAAMADPPQMAVPAEIKTDVLRFMSSCRPIQYPRSKVVPMVRAANNEPFQPARRIVGRFIPKPSITTQACRSLLANLCPHLWKGLPRQRARTIPATKATGGVAHVIRAAATSTNAVAFAVRPGGVANLVAAWCKRALAPPKRAVPPDRPASSLRFSQFSVFTRDDCIGS